MSLLLDALNKADQERQRNQTAPGINSNHEQVHDHSVRNKSIIIAAAVLGFFILLATIYWLGQRSAVTTTTTAISVTRSSIAQQAQASSQIAVQSSVPSAASSTANEPEIDTSEDHVASLYDQNTQTPPANAVLTTSMPEPVLPTNNTTLPSVHEPVAAASPTSINQFANLPDLHDLPNQVLEKIPSLNYSEHNYNMNGGSVKINGNIYRANDQLANGLVIDKILEDGMILHIDNYAFRMRALNSWINM
jgi:general secretion pathway protein B